MEIYAAGGTAIDAGLAAAFALTVVEPYASSLGGHGCLIVHTPRDGTLALDYLSACPLGAGDGMFEWVESPTLGGYRFLTRNDANTIGARSVTAPTAVPAWCSVHSRYGTLPLTMVLAPAIRLAEDGFRLDRVCAERVSQQVNKLARFPDTAAVWLDVSGRPLTPGTIVRQPALAKTLCRLASEGPELFVAGDIAHALVDGVRAAGGILTWADLSSQVSDSIHWHTPVSTVAQGRIIKSSPPPSTGGMAVCELINILAAANLLEVSSTDWIHLFIESTKLTMADRVAYGGDPRVFGVHSDRLTSPAFAAWRAASLDARRAASYSPAIVNVVGDEDTTHHTHADMYGNLLLCTQSLGDPFGSGLMIPGTGVMLNDLMKLFDPRPGRRNSIKPGLKVFSSMAPTIVFEDGNPVLALGSPSGTRIITAVAYVLGLRLFRSMPLEAAIEAPRVHWSGEELEIEEDLEESLVQALLARGHAPLRRPARDPWFGAIQAVERTEKKWLAVSDPRRLGCAAGFGASTSLAL